MNVIDENNVPEFMERIERVKKAKLKIGILGDEKGGERHEDAEISIVHIATIHEFGWAPSGIPERSFMRKTFDVKGKEIGDVAEMHIGDYIEGEVSFDAAMNAIGEYVVSQIQLTLRDLKSPPIKAETIKARRLGGSSPLIHTSKLLDSIEFKVV